jgi:hypothetical protein
MLCTTTGIAVAGEPQQFGQLRSVGIPAGRLVREDPIQNQPVELALPVLVKRTHSHIPNPLTRHRRLQPSYM